MSKYPTGKLQTKFGEVEYAWTEAKHVHVATKSGGVANITVRGIEYYASAHFYLVAGEWVPSENYHELYVSRPNMKEPSRSAREAICAAYLEAWREFAKANPTTGRLAERAKINSEIENLEAETAALRAELNDKLKQINDLGAALLVV